MDEMDDIVQEFLVESTEGLDRLDQDLVALEQDPTNQDLLAAIFRCIHTIKGTCGFLGFSKLESVTHVGENLLSKLRDGKLDLTQDITSALLTLVDAVRTILARIEQTGADGDEDYSQVVATLESLLSPIDVDPQEADSAETTPRRASPRTRKKTAKKTVRKTTRQTARKATKKAVSRKRSTVTKKTEAVSVPQTSAPEVGDFHAEGDVPGRSISESTIRVDVGLLDDLMNLVGELVLARNQVLQHVADSALATTAQHLNLITTELQAGVMKTRMQPIGNIWNKFPRVVRDLAVSCDKQVRIEMDGAETELDKTLIEAIKDPLTHIVRNSVDHGIEPPEVREANGKDPEGLIFLRAYHEGGQVNIEISDDGGGIDTERLKQKAVEVGILSAEQAARMSDRDAVNLIFGAGFSTAKRVTNVSGRGVGMDVVKTNMEKIGGTVDVQSTLGKGTTLKIKIPLTLAIIPALIVKSGGDRYAIPQVSLLELVRLQGKDARSKIEDMRGAPVYRLRGRLLPLVFLNRELHPGAESSDEADTFNIVVLQADDRQFGLVVDGVNDTAEIVVKPLGKLLNELSVFAGATIMGDGHVSLILDVLGLAQRASVVSEIRDRALTDKARGQEERDEHLQTLLLFRTPDDGRMALPLSMVARLEVFPASAVERVGTQDVVQYRGSILPLVHVSEVLPERRNVARSGDEQSITGEIHVVVYSAGDRSVGLVVDRIIDIVEESVEIERAASRECVKGTAVIHGKVTEFLDVEAVIQAGDPTFAQQAA